MNSKIALALGAIAQIGLANAGEAVDAIAFAGVEPGDKIAEFLPINGDWTALLCNAVGETGRVYYVVLPDAPPAADAACANVTTQVLKARNFHAPDMHSDSDDPGWVYEYWAKRSPEESFVSPVPLDAILVANAYLELHELRFIHAAWLAALKPGGTLIVEEATKRIGRKEVERSVTDGGFELVGRSGNAERFALKFRKSQVGR